MSSLSLIVAHGVRPVYHRAPGGNRPLTEPATRIELTPKPLPEVGDLTERPFASLLAAARALGSTGILSLRDEKYLVLSRGVPVAAASKIQEESLEEYFVSKGVLKATEIAQARQLGAATGQRVRDTLASLGLIEANQLFEHTRGHAQELVIRCFGWEDGKCRFEAQDGVSPDVLPMDLDIAMIFREGISRHYDRRRLEKELPVDDMWRVYTLSPTAGTPAIDTIDARLVQLATARPTIQSVALTTKLDPDKLRQRLYGLYCLGIVGFGFGFGFGASVRPPSRSAMPAVTPPQTTSPPSQPQVSAPAPPPATPAPPAAAPAGHRQKDSKETTVPPTRGRERVSTRKPEPAQPKSLKGLLESAEVARMAGDHDGALANLRLARKMAPEDPTVLTELALALLDVDPKKNAREANNLVREAREKDPKLPLLYVVLGRLMEQLGDLDRAEQLYRYALSQDGECDAAQRRIDLLDEKRRGH